MIYTGAATSTALIASVVIDVANFGNDPVFDSVLIERVDMTRFGIFAETNLIYGLEMLAVIATIFALMDSAAGRKVAIYAYNYNTRGAFSKGYSNSPVIDNLIKISRAFAQSSGAWVWSEHVPGARNIADLPTRDVVLPLPFRFSSSFGVLSILSNWVKKDSLATEYFQFYGTPHTGRK